MRIGNIKKKLSGIIILVSWREIARQYFGKPSTWIYGKIDSTEEPDCQNSFNESEMETLKNALRDVADKINKTADSL